MKANLPLPPKMFLGAIEALLNSLIQHHPDTILLLKELNQKVIKITLNNFRHSFYVLFMHDKLVIIENCNQLPALTISGSGSEFLKMAVNSDSLSPKLQFQGDMQVLQQLSKLAKNFDLDWEEMLATKIGDLAARQVGIVAAMAGNWFKRSGTTLQLAARDYLQEEARLSPTKIEVSNFQTAVATLQMDVERLAARLDSLAQR